MCKNIGNLDKAVRVIIGLALIIAGFYYESWWGLIGLIPLLTALSGYCPCYNMCKMNTCDSKDSCCDTKENQGSEMSDEDHSQISDNTDEKKEM